MKFSEKMWLMIILKVTKKTGRHIFQKKENTCYGDQIDNPAVLGLIDRVNISKRLKIDKIPIWQIFVLNFWIFIPKVSSSADLVTFTEEILNRKLDFLYGGLGETKLDENVRSQNFYEKIFLWKLYKSPKGNMKLNLMNVLALNWKFGKTIQHREIIHKMLDLLQ